MFPDLDLPSKTVAMHQSPDGSMFWIVGKDGQLVRVRTCLLHGCVGGY